MDADDFVIVLGLILVWKFLSTSSGEKFLERLADGLLEFMKASTKKEVKKRIAASPMAMAEEGMKVLKSVAESITSMGKTMEAIATKLEVGVETPKPEAAAPEVVESEAEAEEEAEEIAPDLLEAGKCQSLKKDGTQCQMKVPVGAADPWLCGMHRPVKEETAAE